MAATAIELHVDAERELDEAAAIIELAREGWGQRFVAAAHAATRLLMEYPDIGQRARPHLRSFAMNGWPYKIVYSLEGSTIFVWAVAHDNRRPGYWRDRIP